MSDESIISEEILYEESIDESSAYTSAFDLDEINDQRNRSNLSVSFNTKVQQFPIKVGSASDDEYSESFDNEDEDRNETYDMYSTDFENDTLQSNILDEAPALMLRQKENMLNSGGQISSGLPSVEIEALQAELALQKLSREIVLLRNQQRVSIQQRRAEMVEKRERADRRRQSYMDKLQQSQERVSELNAEVDRLNSANHTLTLTIKSIEESKLLSDNRLEDFLTTINDQRADISGLRLKISELEIKLTESRQDCAEKEKCWTNEKATLEREKYRLGNEVAMLSKHIEDAEKRFQLERDTMPSHHKLVLEERVRSLTQIEESVLRREESLKVEQERVRQQLHIMKEELQHEFSHKHSRAQAELDSDRSDICKQQIDLKRERKEIEALLSMERSQLDSWRLDLTKREHLLVEKETELERKRTELLIAKQMIEPDLQTCHLDRMEVRTLQAEAQRIMAAARETAQIAERAAAGVEEREARLQSEWEKLEAARVDFLQSQRDMDAKNRVHIHNQKILSEERLKLHACGIELSRQFANLQKFMACARKMGFQNVASQLWCGQQYCDDARVHSDETFNDRELVGCRDALLSAHEGDNFCFDCEVGVSHRHSDVADVDVKHIPRSLQLVLRTLDEDVPTYHKYQSNQKLLSKDSTPLYPRQRNIDDENQQTMLESKQQSTGQTFDLGRTSSSSDVHDFGRSVHHVLTSSSSAVENSCRKSPLLDSLEYSFVSVGNTVVSREYGTLTDAQSHNLDNSIYGLKVSTDALKNAAIKYGIIN